MKVNKKYFKPVCSRNAIFSFQLINNKGTPTMVVTTNKFDWKKWSSCSFLDINCYHFGRCLAEEPLLAEEDHEFLQAIFESYVSIRKQLTGKSKYK